MISAPLSELDDAPVHQPPLWYVLVQAVRLVGQWYPDTRPQDLFTLVYDGRRVLVLDAPRWPAPDGCWVAKASECRHGFGPIPEA